MAGKKGMKQARPRTQAERDVYALGRIEYLIDQIVEKHALTCQDCGGHIPIKDLSPAAVTLLKARYDKLRATKTETEITHKTHWTDAIKRISSQDSAPQHNAPVSQDTHKPHVTH